MENLIDQFGGTAPAVVSSDGSAPATREQAVRALLEEVMWWHSDPTLPDYNGCDTDPCTWCECAKSLLAGTADYAEIVKIRPNSVIIPYSVAYERGTGILGMAD